MGQLASERIEKMKPLYKPCCGKRCMVGGCEIRDAGGCYCVCRLKDHESTLLDLLDGSAYAEGTCIIHAPCKKALPLNGFEKEHREKQLKSVREKLKTYEIGVE